MSNLLFEEPEDLKELSEKWKDLSAAVKNAIMALAKIRRKASKKKVEPAPYNAIPIWCEEWKAWKYTGFSPSGFDAKKLKELAFMFPDSGQLRQMIKLYLEDNGDSVWEFFRDCNRYASRCQPVQQNDPAEQLAQMEEHA